MSDHDPLPANVRPRPVVFVVDPSMYGAAYAAPRDVYGDLDRVVRTDLFYHYSTPTCAQRWLDVCQDPLYGHVRLLGRVRELMPAVAQAMRAGSHELSRVELISLGPGDGSVDECMLSGLAETLELASYTALDFSFELLRCCVNRIRNASGLPAALPLFVACGDFTDPGSVALRPLEPGTARVFALTGFTLGNYPEDALLKNIRALMADGDYLFLDARLHDLGARPDPRTLRQNLHRMSAPYDAATVRRFVTGPLEVATTASVDELRIGFELRRALTVVPGALNLVIYCSGLDATMRLTGARAQRSRLDLAVTTSYHLPDLERWFENCGLTPVWQQDYGDAAFFLLQR